MDIKRSRLRICELVSTVSGYGIMQIFEMEVFSFWNKITWAIPRTAVILSVSSSLGRNISEKGSTWLVSKLVENVC
jgi:hypothetical protein